MLARIRNWIKSQWHRLMKTKRRESILAQKPQLDPDYKFIYLNRKARRSVGTSKRWARVPK